MPVEPRNLQVCSPRACECYAWSVTNHGPNLGFLNNGFQYLFLRCRDHIFTASMEGSKVALSKKMLGSCVAKSSGFKFQYNPNIYPIIL